MAYPMGKNFSKYPMATDSPYAVSWWYRKQFTIRRRPGRARASGCTSPGINYRANIYVNGKTRSPSDEVGGGAAQL